jgi:hypothetical protein
MAASDVVFGVLDVCFKVFYMNVVYVAIVIYACCKYMFHVASICFKCFKCFLRIFQLFHLDIVQKYLWMLQAYVLSVSGVSYVYYKCFI